MIQLIFEAADAEEALATEPVEVGYAQHQGGQRADWDGGHVVKEDETHPLAHAGAGSHSSHYRSALFLGHSGDEGFGCDNTTGPDPGRAGPGHRAAHRARPRPTGAGLADLPRATGASASGAPTTGPPARTSRPSGTSRMTWAEDTWRNGVVTVPSHTTLDSGTTSFACGAMEAVSALYITYIQTPWLVLGGIVALVVAGALLARRTRWSPAPIEPLDRRRRSGEVLRSAARLYRRHPALFFGIGAHGRAPRGCCSAWCSSCCSSSPAWECWSTWPRATCWSACSGRSWPERWARRWRPASSTPRAPGPSPGWTPVSAPPCATSTGSSDPGCGRFSASSLQLTVVAALLAATVVGIPVAVVYLVRRLPAFVACMVEELGAQAALRRSRDLVRGRTVQVAVFTAVLNLFTTAVGPFVGLVVLLVWSPSLTIVNLIGGVLYTVAMPFAGIGFTLLFYDLRRRRAAAPAEPDVGGDTGDLAGPPPEAPVPAEV